ncbi:hypothetical protein QFZ94_004824 [Paraburkholderia sp. JPY465]|uniref:hypothetical protein n=1 Tax=Paraburkholderia sp. JPY465 TaxID=3042285 RepID=UPI003D1AB65B
MTELEELRAQAIAHRLIIEMLVKRAALTPAERAEMLVSARSELALNDFAVPQPFLQAIFDSFSKFVMPASSSLPPWMTSDPD